MSLRERDGVRYVLGRERRTVHGAGACCWLESCYLVEESNCNNVGGDYNGDFSSCAGIDCTAQPCDGDVNEDGFVNVSDLLGVIASWNDPYTVDDLLTVIANWNSTCK